MLITAMEPRRGRRTALFLDGELAVTLDAETLLAHGWKIGREITDEELHEMIERSESRRAGEKALYLLEHRNHSKKELADKIARTPSRSAAQEAAEHMEELGLVNDEAFARSYASELFCRKGFAAMRVRQELLRKGIAREVAEAVIDELAPEPEHALRDLVERRYARQLSDEKDIRRTVAALGRLGYRYDEIRSVLRDYLSDEPEGFNAL